MFPDAPRLELDELLTQVIVRAEEVLATQGRLRGLLAANRTITADLTLPHVLRRIVEAGCQLARARYGALGVLAPDGGLAEFVHVGLDDHIVARIGQLPEGKGLLGALIDDPRTIRLRSIEDDPRSVGFPPHHPPMTSFLGVPVLVRGKVFGNLYLTERIDGGEFTADDEELVTALAATAGVAIENARLYEQSQRRQDWLQASAKITRQLLSAEGEEPLRLIAREARQIADADVVTVVLPTESRERMMVEVAAGRAADELTGLSYPIEHTLTGLALTSGRPVLVGDADDADYESHLSRCCRSARSWCFRCRAADTRGALVDRAAARPDRGSMTPTWTWRPPSPIMPQSPSNSPTRARIQQRMVLLEDRDRIARDLHDHVIQRLFAAGLTVESIAARPGSDDMSLRLRPRRHRAGRDHPADPHVDLPATWPAGRRDGTVRSAVLSVVSELEPVLGLQPRVTFAGPVDLAVPDSSVDDLVAALREALTNVARHAEASCVDVAVEATTTISLPRGHRRRRRHRHPARAGAGWPTSGPGPNTTAARSPSARSTSRRTTTTDKEPVLRWTIPLR